MATKTIHRTCLCGKELTLEDEDRMLEDFNDFVQFLRQRYGTNVSSKEMLKSMEEYRKSGRKAAPLSSA